MLATPTACEALVRRESGDRRPVPGQGPLRMPGSAAGALYHLRNSARFLVDPDVPEDDPLPRLRARVNIAPKGIDDRRGTAAAVAAR